jgi:ligand-binding sensor domain-containing protein
VLDIKKAPDGALWVATLHEGMFRFDLSDGNYRQFTFIPNNSDSLSHNNVCNMYFDSRGWLWAATQGGGLNLLKDASKSSQGKIIRIGKAQGLPNELVGKILEDDAHNIWVSSDEGLAKITPATLHVNAMQKAEGVAINGYWSNAGTKTEKGELIFGGVGGITVVRPDLLQNYAYRPPVVVTNIHVGGVAIAANHARYVGAAAETLTIYPDANSLAVEFAALDYSAPERNRYA